MTRLPIDQIVWRSPDGCPICSTVSPKCVIQSLWPIPLSLLHWFGQNPLELSISDFNLATGLRVVRSGKAMMHYIPFQHFFHLCVAKMGSSITNDNPWSSKSSEQPFQKLHHNSSINVRQRLSFNPFWHIINGDQDVLITIRFQERSHEVNALDIKHLTELHRVLRHLISSRKIPCSLTTITSQNPIHPNTYQF